MVKISIPNLSLVVLIGPSGSGKSTFARKHFLPTEVLSSDACRAMVSDDENNQSVTNEAFALLHYIAGERLAFQELHDDERLPLVFANFVNCADVRVIDGGGRTGFPPQAFERVRNLRFHRRPG